MSVVAPSGIKITAVETVQLPQYRNILWLRLHTDAGLIGLGETFRGADAVAFHGHLDAHIGEADWLFAGVAGAPDRRDIEVALEFELELAHRPAAMHRVGMQADGQARTQRRERGLRGVGRGVVAQQGRRFIDDVGRQVADVVGVPELAFGDRLALQSLDDFRVCLAALDQLLESALVDGRQASGQNDVLGSDGHYFPPVGYQPVCFLHRICQPHPIARRAENKGFLTEVPEAL